MMFEKYLGRLHMRSTTPFGKAWLTLVKLIFVTGILSACAERVPSAAMPQEGPSALAFKKPVDAKDLLENTHSIVKGNTLTRRDLYVEQRLLQLFGGTGIEWRPGSDAQNIAGEVLGLSAWAPSILVNGFPTESLSIDFSWTRNPDGRVSARTFMLFRAPLGLHFEDIVQVFGNAWRKAPLEAPVPHRVYAYPTHPHGNDVILYDFIAGKIVQRIRFEFEADGSINLILIDLSADQSN